MKEKQVFVNGIDFSELREDIRADIVRTADEVALRKAKRITQVIDNAARLANQYPKAFELLQQAITF